MIRSNARGLACWLLMFSLVGCSSKTAVRPEPIFVLEDSDAERGDAAQDPDLVRLTAYPATGGTMFEATFARPLRREFGARIDPYQAQTQTQNARGAGTQGRSLMTNEFSGIQLDLYIDMGSGTTGYRSLLPGTNLTLAGTSRWEKAISLVPDPIEARASIRRYLATEVSRMSATPERKELDDRLRNGLEPLVYHPDVAESLGNTLRFMVPNRVLGGPARAEWGYAVVLLDTGRRIDDRSAKPTPQEPRIGGRVVDVVGAGVVDSEVPVTSPGSGG